MAPSVAWNPACARVDGIGGGSAGFHPVTAPDSDAKIKTAGALAVPLVTTKSVVSLNTCPVGAPPGMVTLNGASIALPSTSPVYTSLRSAPLDDTQNDRGPTAMPQALTRLGSVVRATPGWSEIRSVAR